MTEALKEHPIFGEVSVRELTSGITRYGADNERIVIFVFHNNSRATVDTWFEYISKASIASKNERPFLILYDLSRIFFTPYFRKRVYEINSLPRTDLYGATAVVLPNSVLGHIIRVFVKRELPKATYEMETELFNDHAEALAWLRATGEKLKRT